MRMNNLAKIAVVLMAVVALAGCDADKTTDADAREYAYKEIMKVIKDREPSIREICKLGRDLMVTLKNTRQDPSDAEWLASSCRENINPDDDFLLSDVTVHRNKGGSIRNICSNVVGKNYDKKEIIIPAVIDENGALIKFADSYYKSSRPTEYKGMQEALSHTFERLCK